MLFLQNKHLLTLLTIYVVNFIERTDFSKICLFIVLKEPISRKSAFFVVLKEPISRKSAFFVILKEPILRKSEKEFKNTVAQTGSSRLESVQVGSSRLKSVRFELNRSEPFIWSGSASSGLTASQSWS